MSEKRFLILSDGKPGHVNQSVAFARHLGYDYDLVPVSFVARPLKALTYLADRFGIYSKMMFGTDIPNKNYNAVVSAGSNTYYANKVLARRLGVKAIAIMLPKGYRYDFDLIVAQQHDNPPEDNNIISLPINLTYVEPRGHVKAQPHKRYVSLIFGGDSVHGKLDIDLLRSQIKRVFEMFPDHVFWMTTSRRTPRQVDEMLRQFDFDQPVYYSENPSNPIPDFLKHSEYVFLTADSSSMISEAVSFGKSCVEVLPLDDMLPKKNKFHIMFNLLEKQNCLHFFDGSVADCCKKVSLAEILKKSLKNIL